TPSTGPAARWARSPPACSGSPTSSPTSRPPRRSRARASSRSTRPSPRWTRPRSRTRRWSRRPPPPRAAWSSRPDSWCRPWPCSAPSATGRPRPRRRPRQHPRARRAAAAGRRSRPRKRRPARRPDATAARRPSRTVAMLEPLVAPDASPGKPASPNPPPPQPAAAHRHERPRGQVLEAVLAVAAGLFDCRCAMLWTMDAGRLRLAAARGLPAGVDGTDSALARLVDADAPTAVVADAGADPRLEGDPLVAGDGGVRFYMAALLR